MNQDNKLPVTATTISTAGLAFFIDHVLKPQLPYSLPLLRRCQYHVSHGSRTPTAEIWVASVPDESSSDNDASNGGDTTSTRDGRCWLAAHIDLSNAGQTQVWLFASWEAEFSMSSDPTVAIQQSADFHVYKDLFDTLFRHLQKEHVPKLSLDPPAQWRRLDEGGKIVSRPFSRSKVLFGTLAECHWTFLDGYSSAGQKGVTREDKGYLKYIILSEPGSASLRDVPDSLYFSTMEERHLQTILDRSNIPRTLETLRQLHIVGLFNQEKLPIAWGMLGKDASISSLHTETEYRRKGLAEVVSKRLLADQVNLFVTGTETAANSTVYSHADVSESNLASRKVMEKLGGKVMWKVAWIEVELGEGTA